MEAEKRAVGALRLLSWLKPGPRGGRALPRAARPSPESPRPRERWAAPASRSHLCIPQRHCSPDATACRAGTRQGPCAFAVSPGLQTNASRPKCPWLPGPLGALLAGAVYPTGSNPRERSTRSL
jgi:hypothetical protein